MKKNKTIVIVSGYFNPMHIGHLRMFQEAKELGNYLIVIINNDKQVKLKGSVPFLLQKDRAELVQALKSVNSTVIAIDKDKTVCNTLSKLYSTYNSEYNLIFGNGGDRKNVKDIPEAEVCKRLGIKMVFNVGGKKIQSSSKLISEAKKYAK